MKDIEKLLKMTERPQDYSNEELQQLMSDPEMREYYELMVSAEEGFALRKEGKENHGDRSIIAHVERITRPVPVILRIAAIFIGVLLLSGIAYAAIHIISSQETEVKETVAAANPQPSALNAQLAQQPQTATIRTFENAELQEILQALSDHYHVGVEYRNEASRHVRLYTKWDTTAPLRQIIELLNGFEKVSVRLSDNQIIAE